MADLSIVIPARNERWVARTVADILEHSEADTEVVVVLDGAWAEPGIPQHTRVHIVYLPQPIGQRAATNLGVRLSSARYVMKCDGHVSFDQGFDRKLIQAAAELGDDVTQIPAQKNLQVAWRLCPCGRRDYQGPTDRPCVACGRTEWTEEEVWKPRGGTTTTAWHFDSDLHFQYFGNFKSRPEGQGEIHDTMSCLGACWFLSRERYWQLGGLDEAHGSWGQMGTELGCKSWLSGGRMVTNERTWFAHLFRTQGGNFGFPYQISGSEQERARQYSRDLWRNNKWSGQIHPLRWLVDRFWPVPGWTEEQRDALPQSLAFLGADPVSDPVGCVVVHRHDERHRGGKPAVGAGIVWYSDCRADEAILAASQRSVEASGLPIVAVTLKPIHWPAAKNIVIDAERSYLSMFRQILAGLEALDTDIAFLAEHDVLYAPEHFAFTPSRSDRYYYNQHVWKVDVKTGHALHYRCSQTSGLCADRRLLVEHYRKRVAHVERYGYSRNNGFEPGTRSTARGGFDDVPAEMWMSTVPNVDLRHDKNLTPNRWRKDQFRNQRYTEGWTEADAVPHWGRMSEFLKGGALAPCA